MRYSFSTEDIWFVELYILHCCIRMYNLTELILMLFSGTKEERGIISWNSSSTYHKKNPDYLETSELYVPPMTQEMRQSKWLKFVPFLPEPEITLDSLRGRHVNDVTNEENDLCL